MMRPLAAREAGREVFKYVVIGICPTCKVERMLESVGDDRFQCRACREVFDYDEIGPVP